MPWLDYLLTVDWVTSGKTALSALIGAGLGSAFVQGAFSLMGERRRQTAHATYLAMRIAVLLDAFGLACSAMISRNASAEHHRTHEFPDWDIKLPELLPYAEDIEGWVSLDRALASRCMRLHSQLRVSQEVIYGTQEYSENDLGEAIDEQAAHMGLEAWRLASDLHQRYHLDHAGGEYVESLQEVEKRAIKVMQDRRERERLARSSQPRRRRDTAGEAAG